MLGAVRITLLAQGSRDRMSYGKASPVTGLL